MSLFDVSKTDPLRGTPTPNTNDETADRQAHNTMGTTYKTESTTTEQRLIFKNGLILTYDSENRVSSVYGYVPELSDIPVLIIAKAGYDVYVDVLGITAPTV